MRLVLKPELVPRPLWHRSVYQVLRDTGRRGEWEQHRRTLIADAKNTCTYCGVIYESRLLCHEHWNYDDAQGVATLSGFVVSCQSCNFALHIGMAAARLDRGREGVEQMMKVNAMSEQDVHRLVAACADEWRDRSAKTWRIEVSPKVEAQFPGVSEALALSVAGRQERLHHRRRRRPSA